MNKLPEGCDFEPQYVTEALLQHELLKVIAERDEWKRKAELPMNYKRMEFNAQLQNELAAVTAERDEYRTALEPFAAIYLGTNAIPHDFGLFILSARVALAKYPREDEVEQARRQVG